MRLGLLGLGRIGAFHAGTLAALPAGRSAVLLVRGEPGIGKTELLRYLIAEASGFAVARVAGSESEMELPFAGLHQLCAPMLGRLGSLAEPQRRGLSVAFGLASGDSPDRFLVALAALSLMAEASEEKPMLCVVDDAQWLDQASAQVLGFVGRPLLAEPIVLVFAVQTPTPGDPSPNHLAGLPELQLGGLDEQSARALLATVTPGPLDESVRARILEETHGHPLALLELYRGRSVADLAGGFALPDVGDLPRRIEDQYAARLGELPDEVQRLVLLAAADPVGDPGAERPGGPGTRPGHRNREPGRRGRPAGVRCERALPAPPGAFCRAARAATRNVPARPGATGGSDRYRHRRQPLRSPVPGHHPRLRPGLLRPAPAEQTAGLAGPAVSTLPRGHVLFPGDESPCIAHQPAEQACPSWMTGRSSPRFIEQRAANICDVDYSDETGVVGDRQVPETAGQHGVSRVTDACRRLDDAQVSGHQFMEPDGIGVPPVRHQLDKVRLRDEAYRPIGPRVHEHESGHTFTPHQVCGRGHVVVPFHRRHRRPHNVGDVGRGRWRRHGRLLRGGFCHHLLRFRDLDPIPGILTMLHAMTGVSRTVCHRRLSPPGR